MMALWIRLSIFIRKMWPIEMLVNTHCRLRFAERKMKKSNIVFSESTDRCIMRIRNKGGAPSFLEKMQ